jgi:hypothetical protein
MDKAQIHHDLAVAYAQTKFAVYHAEHSNLSEHDYHNEDDLRELVKYYDLALANLEKL